MKEYHSNRDGVPRTGKDVDDLLSKIEDLTDATHSVSGMMSGSDKRKLDDLEEDEEFTIEEINQLLNF